MKINFGPSPGYIISLILHSFSLYIGIVIFLLRMWPPFLSSLQRYFPITGTQLTLFALLFMVWGIARAFYIYHYTSYCIADTESNPVLEIGRPYALFGKQVDGIFCQLVTDCDYKETPLQIFFKSATFIIESADSKRIRIPYAEKELLEKLRNLCPRIKVLGTI